MTDRELLELAAKAAGKQPDKFDNHGLWFFDGTDEIVGEIWSVWNPLEHNGHAFSLAANKYIGVDYGLYDGEIKVRAGRLLGVSCFELIEEDACAATRRAIVRAAAEIGKGM